MIDFPHPAPVWPCTTSNTHGYAIVVKGPQYMDGPFRFGAPPAYLPRCKPDQVKLLGVLFYGEK